MVRDPGFLTDGDPRSKEYFIGHVRNKLKEGHKNDQKTAAAKKERERKQWKRNREQAAMTAERK